MSATVEKYRSDVFFTDAVKAVQTRRGSRAAYARKEARDGFGREITPDLAEWLAGRDSFYMSTASADGQPYIQHRGGPPALSASWTSTRSPSPIIAATASTSRSATSPRTTVR